jgi:post-segregation antitoxin (ccd killing protein)
MNMTVYVPGELGKRINARKGELNVSRVFQEAIERELEKLEAVGQEGMEKLRRAKAESDEHWKTAGERDGMEWALQRPDYDLLLRLRDFDTGAKYTGDEDLPLALAHVLREEAGLEWDALFGEHSGYEAGVPNRPAYAFGFLAGARRVLSQLDSRSS